MGQMGLDLVFGDGLGVYLHAFAEGGYVGGDEESDTVTGVFECLGYFECYASFAVGACYVDYYFVGLLFFGECFFGLNLFYFLFVCVVRLHGRMFSVFDSVVD